MRNVAAFRESTRTSEDSYINNNLEGATKIGFLTGLVPQTNPIGANSSDCSQTCFHTQSKMILQ
jgi:hypothetical protein